MPLAETIDRAERLEKAEMIGLIQWHQRWEKTTETRLGSWSQQTKQHPHLEAWLRNCHRYVALVGLARRNLDISRCWSSSKQHTHYYRFVTLHGN